MISAEKRALLQMFGTVELDKILNHLWVMVNRTTPKFRRPNSNDFEHGPLYVVVSIDFRRGFLGIRHVEGSQNLMCSNQS
jgi:hypothetical protein